MADDVPLWPAATALLRRTSATRTGDYETGDSLRRMYQSTLRERLPACFATLLSKLP